ncbi:MAG: FprA family A-type flavoprotein [bacterium]|nr:FprA family A-type flavoprotein [bacterium]
MGIFEIKAGIFSVGALHWDRRLFDELIPLPDGTTYNAYLVKGSGKTALIDTVDPEKVQDLIDHLNELKIKKIDYLIANHAEQDHSGSLARMLELFPAAKVVTNAKCRDFLKDLLLIPEDKFITVQDRETLSLGSYTLEFILTPWVHWPETMVTYLREEKILFSCDFFGSHLAASRLFTEEEEIVIRSAKRYFAEIMMPFRSSIRTNLEKLDGIPISMIAPSHGPVYTRPDFVIRAYKDWTSDQVKNEVLLPYVSMHGSTARMAGYFTEALMRRNITVKPFNLTKTDLGELAINLVDAATIVLGTPMVLAGPHPAAVYAAFLVNALRPKTKFLSLIGSFGWGGRLAETITGMLTNLKAEVLPQVLVKGYPKADGLKALDQLADQILLKHQELKIT